MAFPRLSIPSLTSRRRENIAVLDLGSHSVKAVSLQWKRGAYQVIGFAIAKAPDREQLYTPETLSELFKEIIGKLPGKPKGIAPVLGVDDSVVKQANLPAAADADLRAMLKFSSRNYLHQDLKDHCFDCHVLPAEDSVEEGANRTAVKRPTIVGATPNSRIHDLSIGAKTAGYTLAHVIPNLIATPNAFERVNPEAFLKEVLGLVDVGYKNTTITILRQGHLEFSRVVPIGGERITRDLAMALGCSEEEAEGIKIGMTEDVQMHMAPILSPLGQELRASIDFYEHQSDKSVSNVYFSGGAAKSDFIVQTLQTELMITCQQWNASLALPMALPNELKGEVEPLAPQLAVALGAAVSII